MTKLFILFALVLLAVSSLGQSCSETADTKKNPPSGVQYPYDYPYKSNEWYCMFTFYIDSKPYYIEDLYYKQPKVFRSYFSSHADNAIDEFSWEGTRCNCWIVFYQTKKYQGLNFGVWVDSDAGDYDLSNYLSYDFKQQKWKPWENLASSYSIYCY